MKKVIIALLMLGLLLGCAPVPQTQDAAAWYSFTDDLGSEVVLSRAPEIVAVLFSSYADIWCSAGGQVDITVGESLERGYAEPTAVLVDEGSGHTSIDLERLIDAKPNLVIATADYECQVEAVRICAENGIPAAAFRVESFEDYLRVLNIFTKLTLHPENYDIYGSEVKARIDTLLGSVPKDEKDILFIRAGSTARSTKAKTADENFVCAMLDELGTHNIADDAPMLLDSLSIETILVSDPDYIFVSTMGDAEAARANVEDMFAQSGWNSLSAVKNGNYVFLEKELFHYKPNARWDEAYSFLIQCLHPEN